MQCVCLVSDVCAHMSMLIPVNWLVLWTTPGYIPTVTGHSTILKFYFRRICGSQLLTPKVGTGRLNAARSCFAGGMR